MEDSAVTRIGIVGTGVIGASWAASCLARGLDVIATDPAPGAEVRLRDYVSAAWPALQRMGLSPGADPDRVRFVPDIESCVGEADFVQENGPEREEIKRDTYRRMDAAAPRDVVLATSSSGFRPSLFQGVCRHPERVLVGHPFNPPHLIPLVEIVSGEATSDTAVAHATAVYRRLGKTPIHVRKEMVGHVANRLQAALWREAYHLVDIGAVTVAEVDAAIAHGPGLRWALMGPILLSHLSGGAGGLRHLLDHLGPLSEAIWADLGSPALTEELKSKLIAGVDAEISTIDPVAMVSERDGLLVDLLVAKASAENLP